MFRMMPRLLASAASGTRATAIGGFFPVSAACPRPFLAAATSECGGSMMSSPGGWVFKALCH